MALVISNTAAPSLAINFNGIGVALTVENVPGGAPPAAQIWNLAADAAGGLIVNAAPAPGNPVSPVGNNLVPNNPVNRWNFVPVPGGQFLIHDPATGQLWGVPNLAAGNQVMLGAGNTLWSI